MAAVQEQDTALTDAGEKNIEAARNYSEKHTAVPYYVSPVLAFCFLVF